MSYLPKNRSLAALAKPDSLVYIKSDSSTYGQSIANDLVIGLQTPEIHYGNWTPSINNDIITLPQGYYYYLEQTQQLYMDTNYDPTSVGKIQWYDEGANSYIGTIGYIHKSNKEDFLLESGDEVACAFIDATSSSFTVSSRVLSQTGFLYTNAQLTQHGYCGLGRQIIWRLYA